MFVCVLAAFADSVKAVLPPIAPIVPINVPVPSHNKSPTVNSAVNKVELPVTTGDPLVVVIVPVLGTRFEFAIAVIFPSRLASQAVFEIVLKLTVGVDFLSKISFLSGVDSQPTPAPPALRMALTKYLSRAIAG